MISAVFLLMLAAEPGLADILAAVARSQAQGEKAREQFTFRQETRVRLLRGGGKVAREERRVYDVLPMAKGVERKLVSLAGQYEKSGKLRPYSDPEFRHKDVDIDGDLMEEFSDDLAGGEKNTKDGLDADLFPLTEQKQKKYRFTLAGKREVRGRPAYVITFEPIWKDSFAWKGEMLVDERDLQPVTIATTQSRGVPFLVRSMLGTNIQNLGFAVSYAPFDGVWFPVSYGTEFKFRGAVRIREDGDAGAEELGVQEGEGGVDGEFWGSEVGGGLAPTVTTNERILPCSLQPVEGCWRASLDGSIDAWEL